MAKIDELKEFIGLLKAIFGLLSAVILTITAGLINLYYKEHIDIIFYVGSILDIILIISLPFIINIIIKNIKKLKDL